MGNTYKMEEFVGTSPASYAEATKNAVAEAAKSLSELSWFEVVEQRGNIKNGKVAEFQVKIRIGRKL